MTAGVVDVVLVDVCAATGVELVAWAPRATVPSCIYQPSFGLVTAEMSRLGRQSAGACVTVVCVAENDTGKL